MLFGFMFDTRLRKTLVRQDLEFVEFGFNEVIELLLCNSHQAIHQV